ncbi:hypothetical protein WISP_84744 [Willisornis vidua]|uniref:Transcription factor CBF/NF-Y/archaeal histone domain-containing protein n=1 Tax=Willisornis vidua TaxID=1566151 RepID=A0ABQ9D3K1_9PASS|nr:hypothetical protein WISP_84744 [Willisornis vidua]
MSSKAQELFVETIAKDAYVYAQQGKRKTLQRKDLDNAIEAIDEFAFLEGGLSCVPTKFSSALVKTPHGGEVVQTLENCEMKEKCYRISQVEHYYEIVQSSAGHREERLKEIDVGRCLGSCSSGDHCLLREAQDGEQCLVWAGSARSRCAPHSYDEHTFRSRGGRIRTVVAIRRCQCRG